MAQSVLETTTNLVIAHLATSRLSAEMVARLLASTQPLSAKATTARRKQLVQQTRG